jgi:hypothetical protein
VRSKQEEVMKTSKRDFEICIKRSKDFANAIHRKSEGEKQRLKNLRWEIFEKRGERAKIKKELENASMEYLHRRNIVALQIMKEQISNVKSWNRIFYKYAFWKMKKNRKTFLKNLHEFCFDMTPYIRKCIINKLKKMNYEKDYKSYSGSVYYKNKKTGYIIRISDHYVEDKSDKYSMVGLVYTTRWNNEIVL